MTLKLGGMIYFFVALKTNMYMDISMDLLVRVFKHASSSVIRNNISPTKFNMVFIAPVEFIFYFTTFHNNMPIVVYTFK